MAAVATQVDDSRSLHGATRDAAGERKRQVEGGRAVHVNGVQRGVGAHHVEGSVLGHEQNVRNITAVLLVEMATLFRQVHRLTFGDVLQIHHGICDTTLGADNQPLEIRSFPGCRVTDLLVLGNRKLQSTRDGARPFHRSGDGGSILDRDDLIVALSEPQRSYENEKKYSNEKPAHTRPLNHVRRPARYPQNRRFGRAI